MKKLNWKKLKKYGKPGEIQEDGRVT